MSSPKKLIAGNWKLHKTQAEARALAEMIVVHVGGESSADVVLAPVATSLAAVHDVIKDSVVSLAAQNVYWEDKGAFTGEMSAPLLKDVGCEYCIVGHSERRQYFGESDQDVARKVRALLDTGLVPIVCIGESLEQREAGTTLEIVLGQVDAALEGLDANVLGGTVIAYEPIWAIGTGRTAQPSDAQEVHAAIRQRLAETKSQAWAAGVRLLYGGSVKPSNAQELLAEADIDGALVGGASLEAETFTPIIDAAR